MFRYLQAAFVVRPNIPGLGRVPVNILGVACFLILGLGHPAFWLLGIALETVFLAWLATHGGFQKLVDGEELLLIDQASRDKRKSLVDQLDPPSQKRLAAIETKCIRATDISRRQGLDSYIVDSRRDALDNLAWVYLRLLLTRQLLLSAQGQTTADNIREQIASLQKDLGFAKLPQSIRESKSATLDILRLRLENFERKEQSLQTIDSDTMRIEAQVELALENAAIADQPNAISSKITLASHMLDPSLFGSSEQTIADLDRAYGTKERETA